MNGELKKQKAFGWASKSNHSQIINDEYIQSFLKGCTLPARPSTDVETKEIIDEIESGDIGEKHILTVDGSYTIVEVQKNFPSSQIAFFQFGAILFTTEDLQGLSKMPFISPEDMNKLHNLQKIKLAIPIKNVVSNNQNSLNESIRKAIYDFFMRETSNNISLMETLSWLIFEEYSTSLAADYKLGSNPNLNASGGEVILKRSEMKSDYTFNNDAGVIYLTDVFRLHEAIDEEFGAAGVLGYVSRLIEQIILFRYLKIVFSMKSSALNDFIFITNGPLSFSGQTANMHKVVRKLCNYLLQYKNLFLVGIEKSGPFVDHAGVICRNSENEFHLEKGRYLILSNNYIYKYITPGDPDRMHYGDASYYGGKVIVHTEDSQVFVITLPVESADVILNPRREHYKNLNEIIGVMKLLKCEMYSDSIVPVAIASKLISLTNHPSQMILEKFAKGLM